MATHLKIPRVSANPQWITILPIGISQFSVKLQNGAPHHAPLQWQEGQEGQHKAPLLKHAQAVRHRCEA